MLRKRLERLRPTALLELGKYNGELFVVAETYATLELSHTKILLQQNGFPTIPVKLRAGR